MSAWLPAHGSGAERTEKVEVGRAHERNPAAPTDKVLHSPTWFPGSGASTVRIIEPVALACEPDDG